MKGQAKPFPFEREFTPNGAIVAADTERHLAYSIRWSGSEPGAAGELAALGLDRARSSAELRASLARWKLPAVEVIYADVDGVAGRQVAGLAPIRSGWDGALPAPGWTGTFEWRGWRTLDDLPHALLPRTGGLVVSANQSAARTNRLGELFAGARVFTADDFKRFQHDTTAWNAEQLVPLLAPLHAERTDVESSRQQLVRWNRQLTVDSTAAALYVFWEEALARTLAEARIAPALVDEYVARASVPVAALTKPSRVWFDGDLITPRAIACCSTRSPPPPIGSRDLAPSRPALSPFWGRLHMLTFQHPLAITAGRAPPLQHRTVRAARVRRHGAVHVPGAGRERGSVVQGDHGSGRLGSLGRDQRAGTIRRARFRPLRRPRQDLGRRRVFPAGVQRGGRPGEHRVHR